jgi:stage III sporulation protein AG
MKGVGEVDVMITYENGNTITGVIVTAEGAGNVVVRNNITSAVSGVFNLPVKNVMVFEKENGGATK